MVSLARIGSQLSQILHLHESPHRTALAFAVGAFIAFSPTYGLHTLSVAFCTWAFRLNCVALLAGSLINNPWTVLPIVGATFWTGCQLLGFPEVAQFNWTDLSPVALYQQIWPYAVPFFVGGFVLSLLSAILCYPAAYLFIAQYRARLGRPAADGRPLPPRTGLS